MEKGLIDKHTHTHTHTNTHINTHTNTHTHTLRHTYKIRDIVICIDYILLGMAATDIPRTQTHTHTHTHTPTRMHCFLGRRGLQWNRPYGNTHTLTHTHTHHTQKYKCYFIVYIINEDIRGTVTCPRL